jgi:hypothetical protein
MSIYEEMNGPVIQVTQEELLALVHQILGDGEIITAQRRAVIGKITEDTYEELLKRVITDKVACFHASRNKLNS